MQNKYRSEAAHFLATISLIVLLSISSCSSIRAAEATSTPSAIFSGTAAPKPTFTVEALSTSSIQTVPPNTPSPVAEIWTLDTMSVIQPIIFSPDRSFIGLTVTDGDEQIIQIWDLSNQRFLYTRGTAELDDSRYLGYQAKIVLSPDWKWLAMVHGNIVKLCDMASGAELHILEGHTSKINAIAVSPDGKWLASASDDQSVKLWDAAGGTETHTLKGVAKMVFIAFSPDSKWLIASWDDEKPQLWDVASGKKGRILKGHTDPVLAVVFSPDGKWLASAADDETVRLWNMPSGTEVRTLSIVAHERSLAFSPDGKYFAIDAQDGISIIDLPSGRPLRVLSHNKTPHQIAFSPDGQWLASSSHFEPVKIWEVGTGKLIANLEMYEPGENVSFSPDGKWLAWIAQSGRVLLWKIDLP